MVVFVVALLATAVCGIIQLNTEELQVMNNHLGMVQSHAIAEAGIEDAIAHKRLDPTWQQGVQRRLGGGDYSVTVEGETLTSIGRSAEGYQTMLSVDITILGEKTPHTIRTDAVRLNQ